MESLSQGRQCTILQNKIKHLKFQKALRLGLFLYLSSIQYQLVAFPVLQRAKNKIPTVFFPRERYHLGFLVIALTGEMNVLMKGPEFRSLQ